MRHFAVRPNAVNFSIYRNSTALNIKDDFFKCTNQKNQIKTILHRSSGSVVQLLAALDLRIISSLSQSHSLTTPSL